MQVEDFENKKWRNKNQKMNFRLSAALAMIKGGSVLDLGCGDGLLLSKLRERGIAGEGLDISQIAVKKAKEIGVKAEVFDFSVNKLPFSDKSFENVVLLDVLEHLYAPFDILKEAVRVSKQNIIIAAPNFNSIAARWQMLIGKTPENNQPKKGHIYWFNLNVLRGLLKQSGLEIIELKTNTIFEHRVLLKNIFQFLLNFFPNVFALSFVVKARQIYE
ncbi:MAG: hypothetical protein COT34_02605 [Candidatus Nealsonbacteria bacterium CG08_land_8_20_14_0_20_43_11]|uniref:Methionine biosynthesis protein MetW n=1 Tax=Candidatus Nealsonbacteria bacterium CG08_land_8_20_14_0_20_43_11 TaxID=1974706 RepID=A0A2M6T0M3_9BACT|nr:MAG: hypothetical protein COT34_02605 [Candidatus Nealsonbacteria bacterium CG08_land_8_20_14_0_20_43_11]